ncbi:MAG: hypothetical protein M3N53_06470 [Actinomycetota bacterium]|nr:hypothetical protein [Actinomycetota bacterium]
MKKRSIAGLTIVMTLGVAVSSASGAGAPVRAVAYINPDSGAATENSNVNPTSDCEAPDQRDRQRLSAKGTSDRNVHVDACLSDTQGQAFDGTATFASRGAGSISACPDPDQVVAQAPQVMNGPRVAYLHDHNSDGRNDHCHQTGYQMKDAAGDDEYHVRVNDDTEAGRQTVTFCFDPQQDPAADASGQPQGHGCRDTDVKSRVIIRWIR